MSRTFKIALAGNPNSGKTTVFNSLTGSRHKVGNYPGVTVEKMVGTFHNGEDLYELTDLPGTYSLTAYTAEELIARNFILRERPDVVVDVVDSTNLERSLYLATQLMQLGVPLVLDLNMSDEAKAQGVELDTDTLSQLLRVPIVSTVGHKGRGLQELRETVIAVAEGRREAGGVELHYGNDIEAEVDKLVGVIASEDVADANHTPRWLAVKFLEHDADVEREFGTAAIRREVEEGSRRIEALLGGKPEDLMAERRYGFISGACQEAALSSIEQRHTLSDRIDAVLTSRAIGLPVFLGLMYLVFFLTFRLGSYPMTWIEHGVEWLGSTVVNTWPADWAPDLRSLVVDGIIGGVGGVIVFLPNILLLFLAIAFLEGTGYMARAAFIMDQLMHKIGLHGKSFIPMLIGFGCSVPAILATRTLENRRDRLTTMLVLPLMSCGARLTIYALFIPAFFPPAWQAPVLWIIYFTGILLAVGAAKLLRVTVLRGETVPFVMELPPYRMPPLHGVLVHMWERAWEYLRKAGTVILALSVVLWALTSYPKPDATETAVDDGAARLEKTYEAGLADVAAMIYAPTETIPHEPLMSPEQSTLEEPWPVLVSVIDNVSAARSDYEQALEGLHEDNTARKAELRLQRDAILSGIREQNPQLYTVALHYIDDVYEPYHAAKERLEARQEAARLQYSIAGRIGRGLEPVLRPLGFDWRIGTALIGAMAAKEVFVAQMGIVFSLGEEGGTEVLRQKLREHYTPLVGFCVMLFCLISTPCVATIAATRQESGSWKWALFQLIGLTVLAYAVTMLVYQGGAFFGWGT